MLGLEDVSHIRLCTFLAVEVWPLIEPISLELPRASSPSRSFFRNTSPLLAGIHAVEGWVGRPYEHQVAPLSLHLPTFVVAQILARRWRHILIPHGLPLHTGWSLLRRKFGISEDSFYDNAVLMQRGDLHALRHSRFNIAMSGDLATTLRGLVQKVEGERHQELHAKAVAFIECLDNSAMDVKVNAARVTSHTARVKALVEALHIAEHLSADGHFRKVLESVCGFLLPKNLVEDVMPLVTPRAHHSLRGNSPMFVF